MRPVFDRWRAVATKDELVSAAGDGPPTLRALALRALVIEPASRAGGTPMGQAPPPPTGPIDGIDDATVDRLLASAIDVLGRDGSLSTHDAAIEAAYGLARGNLARILPATDAIADLPLRYMSSWSLHRSAAAPYVAYRRERELLATIWMALPFALAAVVPRFRRFAVVGILAAIGWGVTTYLGAGPLDLPPWPYPLSKPRFLIAAAVALTAWAALAMPGRRRLVCFLGGGVLFLAIYVATRAAGFYPPDTLDGMLFAIEPALGVALSGPFAYVLAVVASRVPPS
jgi:hypothetical protein